MAPGETAELVLSVRNTGTVVDEFTVEALGAGAAWVSFDPPVVPLFPAAEETVTVQVTPPRSSDTAASEIVLGVRAVSREDNAHSAVAEARLTIPPFADLFAELTPRTTTGRRQAKTELAVDNRGNAATEFTFTGQDADGNVDVEVDPPVLTVDPGTAAFADVRVRPRKTLWRGTPRSLPFQVVAAPDGAEPLVVDGIMLQQPRIPKWLLRALLLLAALILLAILLWFTLLKPTVESAAKDAVDEQIADAIEAAGGGGGGGGATTTTTTTTADDGSGTTETTEPPPAEAVSSDLRLTANVAPGGDNQSAFAVPAGQTYRMTDLVLQNPAGDVGNIEIRRDGAVLLSLAMQNFRDIDYHFVTPITFTEGQSLVFFVSCDGVAPPGTQCTPAASFVGLLGPG